MSQDFKKNLFLFFLILFFSPFNYAIDKALLIGVSEYQSITPTLPGVSLDLDMMDSNVKLLGFKKENIIRLDGKKATKANIKNKITHWLKTDVSAKDRVLIYFSGHGSGVKDLDHDEADLIDEVLLPYDAKIISQSRKNDTLKNAILDDELKLWLTQIPSKKIIIFIDSCHSGTLYKGITLGKKLHLTEKAQIKYFTYSRMPSAKLNTKETLGMIDKKLKDIIFLSATQDNESALATQKGSIFTLGLFQIIHQASINKEDLSPLLLHKKLTAFIRDMIETDRKIQGEIFHPQLMSLNYKNDSLFPKEIMSTNLSQKVVTNTLDPLLSVSKKLFLTTKKARIQLNEKLFFDLKIPENNWFLNIVYIAANGEQSILFPNIYQLGNQIPKGTLSFPTEKMNFDIYGKRPRGNTYLYAFLTKKKVDFYEESTDGFNKEGDKKADSLPRLSARAIAMIKTQKNYYMGRLKVIVQ